MKQFIKLGLLFTFFWINSNVQAQNDFGFISFVNAFKGSTIVEENRSVVKESPFSSIHLDVTGARTFESKYWFVMDGSALTFFNNGTYNFGLLDTKIGLSLHPKHPIRIGDNFEMIFGTGAALGFKIFNLKESRGSFLAYGLALNCIINVGDNFQVLYTNTATPGYNPYYDEISRVKHEFFIMYNINEHSMLAISPYVETFRYNIALKEEFDYTSRVKGLRLGVIGFLD